MITDVTSLDTSSAGLSSGSLRFKPTMVERLAVIMIIWVISGFGVFANYQTDACPPEVKRREAIRAGVWAPLVLAGSVGSAELVSQVFLRPVVGWSYLILLSLLVIFVLRSQSRTALCFAGFALASLCAVGLACAFYMNAHPAG
ncbi:MAG: hypothetical protein IPK22_09230 [Verrucomicrobiaceae bacterium]|nr:hypothetical protein [Verrucomicrobiaceae bacterium]